MPEAWNISQIPMSQITNERARCTCTMQEEHLSPTLPGKTVLSPFNFHIRLWLVGVRQMSSYLLEWNGELYYFFLSWLLWIRKVSATLPKFNLLLHPSSQPICGTFSLSVTPQLASATFSCRSSATSLKVSLLMHRILKSSSEADRFC